MLQGVTLVLRSRKAQELRGVTGDRAKRERNSVTERGALERGLSTRNLVGTALDRRLQLPLPKPAKAHRETGPLLDNLASLARCARYARRTPREPGSELAGKHENTLRLFPPRGGTPRQKRRKTVTTLKVNCGKGLVLDVDTSKLGAEVTDHCFQLGLKTALRNVHAGVDDREESNQKSREKLESFYRGEVHRAGGNGFAAQVAEKDAEIAALKAQLEAMAAKGVKRGR